MTHAKDAQLSPEVVLGEMTKNGVTHVVWLPDSETNFLYQLMRAEPSLSLVPVSREGLAFSIAAGLATGGGTPIILIQNTGLMESGDSLRGWALGLNIPVVLMVGYRGWTRHGVEDFEASLASILAAPGPVFVALKVVPEVENVPIGQRARWQTRTRDRVLADLRAELGVAG